MIIIIISLVETGVKWSGCNNTWLSRRGTKKKDSRIDRNPILPRMKV